jgi:Winged helix-turn helix
MARAGRVGGQHCDGSVGTGFYQVTLARLAAPGGWPRRRADRSAQGHEAGGPLGSGLPRPPKRSSQWTLDRIAIVIQRLTGVRYHPAWGWALLRHRLGWTVQRPRRRAAERDQAAIDHWVAADWPRIKKRPAARCGDLLL